MLSGRNGNPKPEFAGLYEFENAVMEGLRKKVEAEKPAVTAEDLKAAFGGEKKKEPDKGYDVSAADLKRAFGGAAAVPIDEMDRGSADVTMADLKKAFAQAPKAEPEPEISTAVLTMPEQAEIGEQLGDPPGWLSCTERHENSLHEIEIRNNTNRDLAIKVFLPHRNDIFHEYHLRKKDREIHAEYWFYQLSEVAGIDKRAFDKNCYNYRIQVDGYPIVTLGDYVSHFDGHACQSIYFDENSMICADVGARAASLIDFPSTRSGEQYAGISMTGEDAYNKTGRTVMHNFPIDDPQFPLCKPWKRNIVN